MPQQVSPIPAGFHTLTPHICVDGAAAYSEFLTRAFGAVETGRATGPGGKLIHVEARIGDSVLMFSDDFSAEFNMPPLATGRFPVHLQVYVPDADATYNQAVAAGATPMMPMADQFWGDRYGMVRDAHGIVWAIATRKESLTPEQLRERQAKAFGG